MTHPTTRRTGLDRIVHAFGYSCSGLRSAFRYESAFRQEATLAAVALPLAFLIGTHWTETALLVGSVVLVLIVELLNSAIEATVDRVSPEWNDLAKRAKDYGSAAVFLSLGLTATLWACALWPHLKDLLR